MKRNAEIGLYTKPSHREIAMTDRMLNTPETEIARRISALQQLAFLTLTVYRRRCPQRQRHQPVLSPGKQSPIVAILCN